MSYLNGIPSCSFATCYHKIKAGLPHEINSWLIPVKYGTKQLLLNNWINTGNKVSSEYM